MPPSRLRSMRIYVNYRCRASVLRGFLRANSESYWNTSLSVSLNTPDLAAVCEYVNVRLNVLYLRPDCPLLPAMLVIRSRNRAAPWSRFSYCKTIIARIFNSFSRCVVLFLPLGTTLNPFFWFECFPIVSDSLVNNAWVFTFLSCAVKELIQITG